MTTSDLRPVPPVSLAARLQSLLVEGFRYFLGAGIGLLADWLAWSVLWWLGASPLAAQAVARGIGAVVAFIALRRAFHGRSGVFDTQLRRFVLAALASWVLSLLLVYLLTKGLPGPAAKVAADGTTFAVNWFVMRHWVFSKATAADVV